MGKGGKGKKGGNDWFGYESWGVPKGKQEEWVSKGKGLSDKTKTSKKREREDSHTQIHTNNSPNVNISNTPEKKEELNKDMITTEEELVLKDLGHYEKAFMTKQTHKIVINSKEQRSLRNFVIREMNDMLACKGEDDALEYNET